MQKITYTTDDDGNPVKQTWGWTLISEVPAVPVETATIAIVEELSAVLPDEVDLATRTKLAEDIAKRMSKDELI